MSIDNVLAVFLLPLFGAVSDKCKSKLGRRTPFVLFGTIAAVIAFIALTVIDNIQLGKVIAAGIADMSAEEKNGISHRGKALALLADFLVNRTEGNK